MNEDKVASTFSTHQFQFGHANRKSMNMVYGRFLGMFGTLGAKSQKILEESSEEIEVCM